MINVSRAAFPAVIDPDVQRAIEILKEGGCVEVFLFGSTATGQTRPESDLDLAVRGCPHGHFFRLVGRLLVELEHPIDLVNLDTQDPFAQFLEQEGVLVRVG